MKQVVSKVDELYCYDSPIDEFLGLLIETKDKIIQSGGSDLKISLSECGDFDTMKISYEILETDIEYNERIAREKRDKSFRKKQYETLKKEFENE